MAESDFRRALALSGGSHDFLYTRPITAAFLVIALMSLLYPLLCGFRSGA